MNEEIQFMLVNDVHEVIELPRNYKEIGCEYVFKTKR